MYARQSSMAYSSTVNIPACGGICLTTSTLSLTYITVYTTPSVVFEPWVYRQYDSLCFGCWFAINLPLSSPPVIC